MSDIDHKIRELAYRRWEEAGHPEGDGVEFWLSAHHSVANGLVPEPGMHLEATVYAGGVGMHQVPDEAVASA